MSGIQAASLTKLTLDSVVALNNVVQAVPDLQESALNQQLRATITLCQFLHWNCSVLESESTESVRAIHQHMGTYCREWELKIQDAHSGGLAEWGTVDIRGKTVQDAAAFLQMQTSSIVIGTIHQALWARSYAHIDPNERADAAQVSRLDSTLPESRRRISRAYHGD